MSLGLHVPCFILLLFMTTYTQGQGCVAIRGNTTCGAAGSVVGLSKGEFNAQIGFRYFKSFRHYRGDVQETHRLDEGTEVINHSSFLDISLDYGISDRFFGRLIVPFVYHDRSSMYEHGGNPPNGLGERHETSSSGLSDIRLGLGYWLFNPMNHDFNYSVGLGVKLPTGQYDYMDTFYNQGDNKDENVEKVVDQSIQPGDGGTGITFDVQGFHMLGSGLALNTSLYYLANVQETNGVLTRSGRSEFSCADQYAASVGLSYGLRSGFNLYLGGRLEGVPTYDLIGSSAGYRRPGYAVSVDPGVSYSREKYSIVLNVPIALYRNRIQSFEDKERTAQTGVYRHGDAAFADYLVNLGFSYRFGGSSQMSEEHPIDLDEL